MSNSVSFPWIRKIEIQFHRLAARNGKTSDTYLSDGSHDKLRIEATISKRIKTAYAVSQIRMWNLSSDTQSRLVRDDTTATVRAGWRDGPDTEMRQVFFGTLLVSNPSRQGPDIVTEMFFQAGQTAAVKAIVEGQYPKGTQYRNIVLRIAEKMREYGVTVDPLMVKGINGSVGDGGYSFSGEAGQILTRLGQQLGFWWSVQDGRFQSVHKDSRQGDGIVGITEKIEPPRLKAAAPIHTGIRHYLRGVQGECMLNPNLIPGHQFTIHGAFNSSCNGDWRLEELEHSLDAFSSASFITRFRGLGRRT